MLNHWLLYQTLACRVSARTAPHPATGASRVPDQLAGLITPPGSAPPAARTNAPPAAFLGSCCAIRSGCLSTRSSSPVKQNKLHKCHRVAPSAGLWRTCPMAAATAAAHAV